MVLLVATADEERVDSILDDVESGHILVVSDDDDGGGEHSDPFETLNSFFLASTRLSKDVRDSTGLQRLLEALEVANPNRPPVGIELVTWRKSCELAEGIADGLVEEDGNPDDSAELALQLHDLLRPLI